MKFASYRVRSGRLDDRQVHCLTSMPVGPTRRVLCHAISDMALAFYAYQEAPRYDERKDRVIGSARSFTAFDPAKYARMAA